MLIALIGLMGAFFGACAVIVSEQLRRRHELRALVHGERIALYGDLLGDLHRVLESLSDAHRSVLEEGELGIYGDSDWDGAYINLAQEFVSGLTGVTQKLGPSYFLSSPKLRRELDRLTELAMLLPDLAIEHPDLDELGGRMTETLLMGGRIRQAMQLELGIEQKD